MSREALTALVASLGVLAIVLLGFWLMLRGPFRGLKPGLLSARPAKDFGQGAVGRTVANLLAFAVAYRFFFQGYAGELYGFKLMVVMAMFALLAMTLVPAVEVLISLAALTVFLMENSAVFGAGAMVAFLLLLLVYGGLRWLLGRT
ncbi:MAG TPA: hypothetical protein VFD30_20340 [Terriglobia bacterium]|nr:hypothetical protein [Terriglobia bacterium]